MDKRAVLDELVALTAPPHLEEDEFTASDYEDAYVRYHGKRPAKNWVRNHLNKLVEEGILAKRLVCHNGRWPYAYRMAEEYGRRSEG